jgi:multiple sugar transport system substrate-binding protein
VTPRERLGNVCRAVPWRSCDRECQKPHSNSRDGLLTSGAGCSLLANSIRSGRRSEERLKVRDGTAGPHACGLLLALLCACARPAAPVDRLVLVHQPLFGDPAPFRALLDDFRQRNPGLQLDAEALPGGSDLARQFFLTSLNAGAAEPDVLALDVVWVPEFARAGWIADLSSSFPPSMIRRDFLPAAADAALTFGKTWAVPWYLDVGLLYYRKDLIPRAPRTYNELRSYARAAMARDPALQGYLWQGRQYEGLSCNFFEAVWGHGGSDGFALETPAALAGLEWLRETLSSGLSPPSVASATEEETRRTFQDGRAVFLRNWPYVWAEVQREGSAVKDKVGWTTLPSESGAPGAGALGGWMLAINAHSAHRAAAERLIAHLTSPESSIALALAYSRNPARRATYTDPRLVQGAPFIAGLLPAAASARPRPVSAYYDLAADSLQGELSAAIVGLRPPAEALRRAQLMVNHLEQR